MSRRSRSRWTWPRPRTHGIKPGDVRRAAATLLSGLNVGSLFEDQKVFDVVVWGVPELRNEPDQHPGPAHRHPRRGQVRLGDVATVRVAPTPSVINREGVFRYVDVGLTSRVATSARSSPTSSERARAGRVPARVPRRGPGRPRRAAGLADPTGSTIAIAAAIGILLLLQAAFGSWRLARPGLPDPAGGARRWRARGGPERQCAVAGVDRRAARRAGSGGPDRAHPDQSLPAARAGVGRGVRCRARAARGARTARPRSWPPCSPAACSWRRWRSPT